MTNLLKIKKANRLNFYGVRKAPSAPAHFDYITIPLHYNLERSMDKWIHDNLKGRYYIGRTLKIDPINRGISEVLYIGFEEPKELSYFTLACPHLKY